MREICRKLTICILILIFFINGGLIYIMPSFAMTVDEQQKVEDEFNEELKNGGANVAGLTKTTKISDWKVGDSLITRAKSANWKINYDGTDIDFNASLTLSLSLTQKIKINRVYVVKDLNNLTTDDDFTTSGNLFKNDDILISGSNVFYIIVLPSSLNLLTLEKALNNSLKIRCVYAYVDIAPTKISKITKANVGDGTIKLTAKVEPTNANYSGIVWSVNDSTIAEISGTGNTAILTPKKTGTVKVTAAIKDNSKISLTGSISVVKDVDVKSINITGGNSVNVGKTLQLTASISPSDVTDKTIKWTSKDTKIATVNSTGKVTGVSEGKTSITATASNGINKVVSIEVIKEKELEKITISSNSGSNSVEIGKNLQLTVKTEPEGMSTGTITWTSSNEKIAKVDKNGLVTGIAKGTTNINATVEGGIQASFSVTVDEVTTETVEVKKIEITQKDKNDTMKVGETLELTANISPENATNKNVTWSSSNTNIATVDNNGKVSGVTTGEVIITATSKNGVKGTYNIKIEEEEEPEPQKIPITAVKIEAEKEKIKINEEIELKSIVTPENATNKEDVTWTSLDPDIVEIEFNIDGTVAAKGIKEGTATILLMSNNMKMCTKKIVVESNDIDVENITLDGEENNIEVGEKVKIVPSILPENATKKDITWIISDESLVEYNKLNDGSIEIKGKKEGTIVITAITTNMKIAQFTLTIKNEIIDVVDIEVKGESELEVGKQIKLVADIIPENATNKKITWISGNEDIATIDEDGIVKGISEGTVTIMAIGGDRKIVKTKITVSSGENPYEDQYEDSYEDQYEDPYEDQYEDPYEDQYEDSYEEMYEDEDYKDYSYNSDEYKDSTLADRELAYAGSEIAPIVALANIIISALALIFKYRII